jgi:hypothetical protein
VPGGWIHLVRGQAGSGPGESGVRRRQRKGAAKGAIVLGRSFWPLFLYTKYSCVHCPSQLKIPDPFTLDPFTAIVNTPIAGSLDGLIECSDAKPQFSVSSHVPMPKTVNHSSKIRVEQPNVYGISAHQLADPCVILVPIAMDSFLDIRQVERCAVTQQPSLAVQPKPCEPLPKHLRGTRLPSSLAHLWQTPVAHLCPLMAEDLSTNSPLPFAERQGCRPVGQPPRR